MSIDLFVTAGPNRGAYVPLTEGRHTVGASADADIVLEGVPDEGVLVFQVTAGQVKVTPSGGAAARVDGKVLGRGGVTLGSGSVVEFGQAELRPFWAGSHAEDESSATSGRSGLVGRILSVVVVAVGAALIFLEFSGGKLQPGSASLQNPQPSRTPVSAAGPEKMPKLPEAIPSGMAEGLEARVKSVLRGTGLTAKTEGGRLVIVGSVLTAKDEKRLETVIAEVRPYMDVDVSGVRGLGGGNAKPAPTQVLAPARIVAINIVESGPAKSYFETADGTRYFEGAIFGEGYVVSEIRPTVVAMEKGGVKLEYSLVGR